MHDAVGGYIREQVAKHGPFKRVLEIGSLDINGTIRPLFSGAETYVGIDVQNGPGVDVVADGATYESDIKFDCVVSTEALEHCDHADALIANAHRLLGKGGVFLMTCAGVGRPPHSGIDEHPIREWEFYRNVDEVMLTEWLNDAGFGARDINIEGSDIRCWAVKP